MFFDERPDKLRLQTKSKSSIRSRWKFVTWTTLGSAIGLCILLIWSFDFIDDKSSRNESSSSNPVEYFYGRTTNGLSRIAGKSSAGCYSNNCRTVSCSSISAFQDPGKLASSFLSTEFRSQCPHSDAIELLEFKSCTFPNSKLEENWLTADMPIESLSFEDCPLEDFPEGSFASSVFANVKVFKVTQAKIKVLRKRTFDELKTLVRVAFTDTSIDEAEANLFSSLSNSLTDLELNGCLSDVKVLANMTGSGVLQKLGLLSAQRSNFDEINGRLFKSIPNVVSMYLGQSKISSMDIDTLSYTSNLALLDLSNNALRVIKKDALASVLVGRPDFKLSTIGNPWDCSCEFEWIKDLMSKKDWEIPQCKTPERNAGLFFTAAEFCSDSSVDPTTVEALKTSTSFLETTVNSDTSEKESTSVNYVALTCHHFEQPEITRSTRKLLSTVEYKLPSRFHEFYVETLENGSVFVHLRETENRDFNLVWFKSIESAGSKDSSETIHCLTNPRESVLLKNLLIDSSYTICLLDITAEMTSPLNCLAARTRAGNLEDYNVWLTNDDKSVVIPIAISLFIFVGLISAVSSFFLVRKNPALLRGSKRIVIVKKRGIDALVMPKGINTSAGSNEDWTKRITDDPKTPNDKSFMNETNYLNPLMNHQIPKKYSPPIEPRRKDSKISGVSSTYAGSYISAIEATPSELYNWRRTVRLKNYYPACSENEEIDEPPPIPPLPPHRPLKPPVPSVSLTLQDVKPHDTFHQPYHQEIP